MFQPSCVSRMETAARAHNPVAVRRGTNKRSSPTKVSMLVRTQRRQQLTPRRHVAQEHTVSSATTTVGTSADGASSSCGWLNAQRLVG